MKGSELDSFNFRCPLDLQAGSWTEESDRGLGITLEEEFSRVHGQCGEEFHYKDMVEAQGQAWWASKAWIPVPLTRTDVC